MAREWHPTRNGDVRADQIKAGSHRKVWWRCRKVFTHVWQQQVRHRVNSRGCPFCTGRSASKETSLAAIHPKLAKQWHSTRNGSLRPDDVTAGSRKKVWWRCAKNRGHVWDAPVAKRAAGHGCPICSGRRVTKHNSLSLRFPSIAAQWHPTKNGSLTPDRVTTQANRLIWWQCRRDPSHVWRTRIYHRVVSGSGCPVCSGKVAVPETSLRAHHPRLAREWHREKNGSLRPEHVRPGSHKRVWWRCSKNRSHVWQATVNNRTIGRGCPMCAGRIATPETSLRGRCPEVAAEWHPKKNGALTPDDVTPGSNKLAWWRCRYNRNHVWSAVIYSRGLNGSGCPYFAGLYRKRKRKKRPRVTVRVML